VFSIVAATLQPAFRNRIAAARPKPEDDPVIITVFAAINPPFDFPSLPNTLLLNTASVGIYEATNAFRVPSGAPSIQK
jgi:hypothetical protein